MKISQTGRAYAAAITYALIIGFSFMFVKMALTVSNPLDTLAHRFTISLISIWLVMIIARRPFRFSWRAVLTMLPIALFYPFLFFLLQTFGLVYTTSAEAGIVNAAAPIFTMLLASFFLKERSTWLQKLFTLVSVAGVIFIFLMNGVKLASSSTLGIVLILLSALSFAAYSVLVRKQTQKYHFLDMTFMVTLIGCILLNLISVFRHTAEGTLASYFAPFTAPAFIWAILYLGIMSSAGSSLSSNYALSKLEASKMSIFGNLATVITLFAGVLVLHEKLAYYHFIGAAMVIAGVIGVGLAGRERKMPERVPARPRERKSDPARYGG
nr:DMT family transporter [Paenibacillus tuaregi]